MLEKHYSKSLEVLSSQPVKRSHYHKPDMTTDTMKINPLLLRLNGFLLYLMLASSIPMLAQPGPPPDGPVNELMKKQVIDSVLTRLKRGYVYPTVVPRLGDSLRYYLNAGRYRSLNTGIAFAKALTTDLQRLTTDRHLSIDYTRSADLTRKESDTAVRDTEKRQKKLFRKAVNHGIDQVDRLAGNVGLLTLRSFFTPEEAAAKITAAMTILADTDALLIDLRYNAGGHPSLVSYLASYFFPDSPVLLNTMYWRSPAGNQPTSVTDKLKGDGLVEQFWTHNVPGPKYIDKPLYVLVSPITASGGEGFAYIMQTYKKGIVVGEATAGAANPGGSEQITPNFEMFIARGRSENPLTKANWEGAGIQPDVRINADVALTKAYVLALRTIEKQGKYAGPEPLGIIADEEEKKIPSQK